MTEEQFYKIIEETGWNYNDSNRNFGFIIGICHPFVDMKGLTSSHYFPYFTIWKKEGNKQMEENIECNSQEIMLKNIINFLNKPF